MVHFRTSLDNGHRFYRIEIVIVQLSTGTYHTAVTEPVIYVTESRQNINYSKMDISGDILGMWISRCCVINDTPYDVFYLYNWKTGMLKAVRTLLRLFYSISLTDCSFALVAEQRCPDLKLRGFLAFVVGYIPSRECPRMVF